MAVRIEYAKTVQGRWLSHLDLLRVFDRAIRRAGVPVAFSKGFNRHPRISFGSVLPVGISGDREYLDMELRTDLKPLKIKNLLNQQLPAAIKILQVVSVPEKRKSLMSLINMASYEVQLKRSQGFPDSSQKLEGLTKSFMSQPILKIERETKKGLKEIELRKGLYRLTVSFKDNKLVLKMLVEIGSRMNIRPLEVVRVFTDYLVLPLDQRAVLQVHRQGLFIKRDQEFFSPLLVFD